MAGKEDSLPLYEYRCRKCGRHFEKIRKFSDPPVTKCPDCGGAAEQLVSPPAIQFKGSGWYVTDYARKSGAETTKPEAKPEGGEKKDGGPAKPAETPKTPTSNKS